MSKDPRADFIERNRRGFLDKHSLQEVGLWQIFGEDPNCDFGGCHSEPRLGFVEGKLDDVIDYAVKMPGFWTWGAGGRVELVSNIVKVDTVTNARRKLLEAKKNLLQRDLEEVENDLKNL